MILYVYMDNKQKYFNILYHWSITSNRYIYNTCVCGEKFYITKTLTHKNANTHCLRETVNSVNITLKTPKIAMKM